MIAPRASGTIDIDGLAVFCEAEGQGARTPMALRRRQAGANFENGRPVVSSDRSTDAMPAGSAMALRSFASDLNGRLLLARSLVTLLAVCVRRV